MLRFWSQNREEKGSELLFFYSLLFTYNNDFALYVSSKKELTTYYYYIAGGTGGGMIFTHTPERAIFIATETDMEGGGAAFVIQANTYTPD